MGWWIALGVLTLLGLLVLAVIFLPMGLHVVYNASGLTIQYLIGPLRIKEKADEKDTELTRLQNMGRKDRQGGEIQDFRERLQRIMDYLSDLCTQIKVKRLDMELCMAGGDPGELALNYGKAWAAVGGIMPLLERFLDIRKRNVQVTCDFTQPSTTIYVRVDVTIPLHRLVGLVMRHGGLLGTKYENLLNTSKGGTEHE